VRVVLDVNILASASLRVDSVPAGLLRLASSKAHELIVSEKMIKSLDDVLQRPFFAARVTSDERNEFVLAVRANGSLETPDPSVTGVADDAEDDAVLGTAVKARADVIVTGDKGMLAIRTCRGIPIVTAREFLVLVNA